MPAVASEVCPDDCLSPTGISALLADLMRPRGEDFEAASPLRSLRSVRPPALVPCALEDGDWGAEDPPTPTLSEILETEIMSILEFVELCPQVILLKSRSSPYSGKYTKIGDKNGKHAWRMKTRFTECRLQWNGTDRWILVEFDDEMYYLGDIVIDSQRDPRETALPPKGGWGKCTELSYDCGTQAAHGGA